MSRILVTGGCGYVGSVLVPKLLALGHEVTVVDLLWFGNHLKPHRNLRIEKYDFRTVTALPDEDAVIHLAGIANDPQGELNPKLAWEVNALGTMQLAKVASDWGVRQFLYASSGSVYGVSNDLKVTENSALNPISDYNRTKMVAERCVLSYFLNAQILRPGTVCGFSPRMRLDVIVNRKVMEALDGSMKLFGGEQVRPHVHIEDMSNAYIWLLERPQLTGVYNCGFENISNRDLVSRIAKVIWSEIEHLPSDDPRSYRLNSDKLLATGFTPKYSVADAVQELKERFEKKELKYDDRWINLKNTPALSS
jgi:nucleoside-diphosphate-sugar epimerase